MTDERPPMQHGGARVLARERCAKPIFCLPYAFLPHPDHRGMWVRTDWCVLAVACSVCKSKKGELCQDHYKKNGRYTSGTHCGRRSAVRNPKDRDRYITEISADRRIRFPRVRDWLKLNDNTERT